MNNYTLYAIIQIMRKTVTILPLLLFCTYANGEINPFFNGYTNQISFNVGAGVNSGFLIPPPSQFVPYTMFQFQYSQPTTFFRLPARKSISAIINVGRGEKYGWNWDDYSIPIAMLSEDVIPLYGNNWYTFIGLSIGMQAQQNARIGSKLVFGFKLGAGYRISECTSIEAFMQHMSNGNTAPENNSYAFYGLGISYNF